MTNWDEPREPGTESRPADVVLETDIGRDPDDAIALLFLLARPEVRVRAITITPGDADQVALTRFLLAESGCPGIPVGTVPGRAKRRKQSVSSPHLALLESYGARSRSKADGAGWEIMRDALLGFPEATLLTIGPLQNVGEFLQKTDVRVVRSVSMGGYWAGPAHPETMPEFNFDGCRPATKEFLASQRFGVRLLVGKNVTHQVFYDEDLHDQIKMAGGKCPPMRLIHELMCFRRSLSKKLHDPLAAATMLCEDLVSWIEVMPFRRNKGWGSGARPGAGIWAATQVDVPAFRALFAKGIYPTSRHEESNPTEP